VRVGGESGESGGADVGVPGGDEADLVGGVGGRGGPCCSGEPVRGGGERGDPDSRVGVGGEGFDRGAGGSRVRRDRGPDPRVAVTGHQREVGGGSVFGGSERVGGDLPFGCGADFPRGVVCQCFG